MLSRWKAKTQARKLNGRLPKAFMKFLIELNMDGYDNPRQEHEACKEFIEEQLDFTASSVKILWSEEPKESY
jgi:hypothetical protein